MNATATASTNPLESTRHWVPQSNVRGTVDILTSCLTTIILCAWTLVCVSVPAPEQAAWEIFRDRWHLFWIGIFCPDIVLVSAFGQFCKARASTQAFKKLEYQNWSMRHSFFADMGGVHLKLPNLRSFPVDANQLHSLIAKGIIPFPTAISLEMIKDKDKKSGISRSVTEPYQLRRGFANGYLASSAFYRCYGSR